ncbi:hypothetical protein [Hyphomicrobium sp.]|uniref:hypothetical protein n=1 Tax=Hyphomicrobium sp. TaxID=82 RepID=UPI002C3A087F|nr:hypothetical protein [Hyphomicrobium sp.]HRN89790.1 hypothetical protein [Hyphomicrobium sp.]HRQ26421.1 hypothetical protein [Hyphomicrobium sp.]
MASTVFGFRSFFVVWLIVVALMLALVRPGYAGDGTVLHVGEATELVLDGDGWVFEKGKGRNAGLVAVQNAGGSGATRFVVRGLKTGQVELVFRSGPKRFRAHIDVLN